jgi:MFS family permease
MTMSILKPEDKTPRDVGDPTTDPPHQQRNFRTIAWYQIALRVGWIFKTESAIIPAALDSLGASGAVRGFLPLLGRFGQRVPPMLIWPVLKNSHRQRSWLIVSTLTMCLSFAGLAFLWSDGWHIRSDRTTQAVFLVLYGIFFAATGVNQLVLSTLIGKLIPVRRRGLLMLVSNTRGAIVSISCAWLLLRWWLHGDVAQFTLIFLTAASCFLLAAVIGLALREEETIQGPAIPGYDLHEVVHGVWRVWRHDRKFRTVTLISALFGLSMTLFPHYQNLARERSGAGFDDLLPWLISQNAGVAIFSIPAGKLADRHGNRMVLRIILFLLMLAPVLAIAFAANPLPGHYGFTLVYFLLGLTPVTMRVLSNVSLEFSGSADHPRYLAAQGLALALPVILTSNLTGWCLDRYGHDAVFLVGASALLVAWLLTFSMNEPRHGK